MLRYLFLLHLTLFTLCSVHAQTFQQAVFTHKEKKIERAFEKGQKLKVVCESSKGVSYTYRGRLAAISPDTIFLTMEEVGKVGFPLSGVTKIQRSGIPAAGWVFIAIGLLTMLIGGYYLLIEKGENEFINAPLGLEEQKSPGTALMIVGVSLFLSGLLFFKYPPVNHPVAQWELRTDVTPVLDKAP